MRSLQVVNVQRERSLNSTNSSKGNHWAHYLAALLSHTAHNITVQPNYRATPESRKYVEKLCRGLDIERNLPFQTFLVKRMNLI